MMHHWIKDGCESDLVDNDLDLLLEYARCRCVVFLTTLGFPRGLAAYLVLAKLNHQGAVECISCVAF